jgi:hypothetical protein
MKKKIVLFFLLVLVGVGSVSARNGLKKFRTYRGADYLQLGVGANYMFTDVGGNNLANVAGIDDLDFLYTRPTLSLSYQHDWNKWLGNRVQFMYSWFSGHDNNSRNERLFEYNATGAEGSLQFVFYPWRANFGNVSFDIYIFAGIGGMYYQTQWRLINPITGETETLHGAPVPGRGGYAPDETPEDAVFNKEKDRFEYDAGVLTLPFGVGVRFPIATNWALGADIGWHYAFGKNSDFIDGINPFWSKMNDTFATISFTATYQINGGDDCYSNYGKGQYRSINRRR